MKRILSYIFTVVLLGAVSCQERHPALFDDINGVYFNNLSGTMSVTDSIDLTFVYERADEMQIPVRVQLVGRPAEEDRPLSVSVRSDNAEEGVDYIVPQEAFLPAGQSYADYVVTLNRTPALKSEKKMIELEIHENEYFTLPIKQNVQVADTVSTVVFRIYFSDMFIKAPTAWDTGLLGKFTQQKFELICRVLDIEPDDFNDASRMTQSMQVFISAEMTAYVKEETLKKNRGEAYDSQAFDPETEEGLEFVYTE